jgi:hypothetical protein
MDMVRYWHNPGAPASGHATVTSSLVLGDPRRAERLNDCRDW